ncbi:hypothetical protein [Pseudomonas sp. AIG]|jgi:hypothetical protein
MAATLKTNIVQQAKMTYDTLDDQYDALYSAQTTKGRDQLKAMLGAARDAYWKAERDDLRDDNLYVQQLMSELKATNENVQSAIAAQKKAAQIIALFAEAVKLVAAVVALAAV